MPVPSRVQEKLSRGVPTLPPTQLLGLYSPRLSYSLLPLPLLFHPKAQGQQVRILSSMLLDKDKLCVHLSQPRAPALPLLVLETDRTGCTCTHHSVSSLLHSQTSACIEEVLNWFPMCRNSLIWFQDPVVCQPGGKVIRQFISAPHRPLQSGQGKTMWAFECSRLVAPQLPHPGKVTMGQ